jgi:hypothetical protein
MHRVDTATAAPSLPAPQAVGTPGYFTQGDPGLGTPATVPGPDFLNMLQEEMAGVVTGAGLTLDATKLNHTQLLEAIIALAKAYGFSTGDAKFTFKIVSDAGWVMANDGSIGNASSGATLRANADTAALYTLLWDNIADQWCPVYDSSGVKVARGANAAADFAANRRLRLSRALGRAIAVAGIGEWEEIFTADAGTDVLTVPSNKSLYTGATVGLSNSGGALPGGLPATAYWIRLSDTTGKLATSLANAHAGIAIDITSAGTGTHTLTMSLTSRALGEHVGEETHSSAADENGPHAHARGHTNDYNLIGGGTGAYVSLGNTPPDTGSSGLGTPHNTMPPETFMNVMIKL